MQVNDIAQNLATVVSEQGVMLDNIEANMEVCLHYHNHLPQPFICKHAPKASRISSQRVFVMEFGLLWSSPSEAPLELSLWGPFGALPLRPLWLIMVGTFPFAPYFRHCLIPRIAGRVPLLSTLYGFPLLQWSVTQKHPKLNALPCRFGYAGRRRPDREGCRAAGQSEQIPEES
jgi:hypothetical protein